MIYLKKRLGPFSFANLSCIAIFFKLDDEFNVYIYNFELLILLDSKSDVENTSRNLILSSGRYYGTYAAGSRKRTKEEGA